MRIDAYLVDDITTAARQARDAEAAGYAGIFTPEARHDGFLPLVAAAEQTDTIELGTSVAIAFARTPREVANIVYLNAAATPGGFYPEGITVPAGLESGFTALLAL